MSVNSFVNIEDSLIYRITKFIPCKFFCCTLVSDVANEIISFKVVETSLGFLLMLSVKINNIVLKIFGKHNKCKCKDAGILLCIPENSHQISTFLCQIVNLWESRRDINLNRILYKAGFPLSAMTNFCLFFPKMIDNCDSAFWLTL